MTNSSSSVIVEDEATEPGNSHCHTSESAFATLVTLSLTLPPNQHSRIALSPCQGLSFLQLQLTRALHCCGSINAFLIEPQLEQLKLDSTLFVFVASSSSMTHFFPRTLFLSIFLLLLLQHSCTESDDSEGGANKHKYCS
ncbi:hypothetical protein NE237_030818 [Protea cynaroides]|uniref:Uncharacterized protein n=1 Tax=Protea cynaroides TaxID=273540 RepID=A0A9Q0JW56_9MAGN|nr:hypothetical protein NE237_030818 [Protea cynaroides]